MAYEVFTRTVVRSKNPSVTFTPYSRINLNKSAVEIFEKQGVENVLLLWDAGTRKVGIRPIAKKDPRSYRLMFNTKNNGIGFSAKTFMDYINLDYTKSRSYPAEWNEDQNMLEISLPEEAFHDPRQQKLVVTMDGDAKRSKAG